MEEDSIDVSINYDTGDSLANLNEIVAKLKELRDITNEATKAITTFTKAIMPLEGAMTTFNDVSTVLAGTFEEVAEASENIQDSLAASEKAYIAYGNAKEKAAKVDDDKDDEEEKYKELSKDLSKLSATLKKATNLVFKFNAALGKGLGKAMFGGTIKRITEMGGRFKDLIKTVGKYTTALFGIRSAFYAIRNVTNEYLSSQDTAAQQLQANVGYIKYALGSLLAPVLEYLNNLIYKMLQLVQSLVYYFTKVNIFAGKTADSYAGAASSAKELKKQMQGFDELNNIDFSSSSSDTLPSMDLSEINASLDDLIAKFGDWGTILAEKINKLLYSIDWDTIQEKAETMTKNVVKFLNDFTTEIDGQEIGTTIAEALNTAFQIVDDFFQGYNWETLGSTLAEGFQEFIDTFDWEQFGRKLTDGFKAAIETLYGFVTTFTGWKDLGNALGTSINNAFSNIDWKMLGETFSKGFVGVMNSITAFLEKVDWEQIGRDIGTFLANIDWEECFVALKEAIGAAFSGVFEALDGFVDSGTTAKVITGVVATLLTLRIALSGVSTVVNAITWGAKLKSDLELINTALNKVIPGLTTLKATLKGTEVATSGGIVSASGLTAVLGTLMGVLGVVTGAITALVSFVSMLKDGFSALKEVLMVLGIALAAVGAVILGAPVAIAAAVAAVVAAVATIAVGITELFRSKSAIKSTKEAQEDYEKAVEASKEAQEEYTQAIKESADAQDNYEDAIDKVKEAQEKLTEAEKETGLSGADLYEQVQNGILKYADMTDKQKEVYKAYKDTQKAQEDLTQAEKEQQEALENEKAAQEKATEAKIAETKASLENQLAIAKESGNYDDYKTAVVEAYQNGQISAEEARDYIERAMGDMSDDSKQTFTEDIPGDIKEGIDPNKYDSNWTKFKRWFGEKWDNMKDVVGNWFNTYVKPWFTIEKWKNLAQEAIDAIKQKFENFSAKIKTPHFSWDSDGGFQATGVVKTVLETLHLPTSIPKLKVDWYAEGGFPDEGSLFFAGEAGPEMIGNIGNKSAVANNDQITTAIAQATYEAVSRALGEQDNKQSIIVNVGNKKLYDGYGEYANAQANKYGTNTIKI